MNRIADWMNPRIHLARLEVIEEGCLKQFELLQDEKVIREWQIMLNKIAKSKQMIRNYMKKSDKLV